MPKARRRYLGILITYSLRWRSKLSFIKEFIKKNNIHDYFPKNLKYYTSKQNHLISIIKVTTNQPQVALHWEEEALIKILTIIRIKNQHMKWRAEINSQWGTHKDNGHQVSTIWIIPIIEVPTRTFIIKELDSTLELREEIQMDLRQLGKLLKD